MIGPQLLLHSQYMLLPFVSVTLSVCLSLSLLLSPVWCPWQLSRSPFCHHVHPTLQIIPARLLLLYPFHLLLPLLFIFSSLSFSSSPHSPFQIECPSQLCSSPPWHPPWSPSDSSIFLCRNLLAFCNEPGLRFLLTVVFHFHFSTLFGTPFKKSPDF